MHDEPGSAGSATPADDQAEVVATGQPGGRGEHGASGQAERRARPLPRRAARIARPARVRIRSRNPWVLARRRLLGWKVRLPLLTSGSPGAHCKQVWWCPLPHSHGRRTERPHRTRVVGAGSHTGTHWHGRAKTPATSGRPFESTQPRAGSQIGRQATPSGDRRGTEGESPVGPSCGGRHALLACSSAVSPSGRARGSPCGAEQSARNSDLAADQTQCEAPTGLGVPSCTAVDNLWTTSSGRPRHHRT